MKNHIKLHLELLQGKLLYGEMTYSSFFAAFLGIRVIECGFQLFHQEKSYVF